MSLNKFYSEGGFEDERGLPFAASNGGAAIGVTTRRPVLSIRPKATFNSLTNRGQMLPLQADVAAQSNPAYIEIVYNGALSGGSVWTSADVNSVAEFNTDHDGISGGSVLGAFYVLPSGPGQARAVATDSLLSKVILALNAAGDTPDTLSVVATSLTATSTMTAAMTWKELR